MRKGVEIEDGGPGEMGDGGRQREGGGQGREYGKAQGESRDVLEEIRKREKRCKGDSMKEEMMKMGWVGLKKGSKGGEIVFLGIFSTWLKF